MCRVNRLEIFMSRIYPTDVQTALWLLGEVPVGVVPTRSTNGDHGFTPTDEKQKWNSFQHTLWWRCRGSITFALNFQNKWRLQILKSTCPKYIFCTYNAALGAGLTVPPVSPASLSVEDRSTQEQVMLAHSLLHAFKPEAVAPEQRTSLSWKTETVMVAEEAGHAGY